MAGIRLLFFAIALAGCSATLPEGEPSAKTAESASIVRDPRSLHKNKLCRKYGICQGGFGGQGGYGGYQGYQGYQGYPQQQGYQPPINIAISQSQSSANEGGGGHGSGYFPNNYQYNNGYPNHVYPNQGYYNQGYSGYDGYGGYNRPGYGNGNGAYNSQFNGNYYSASPNGGYGFQSPFGYRDDSDSEGGDYDEGDRQDNFAYARSSATAVAASKHE